MELCLNIAEFCPATYTLGPGKRFALWVQGCCFNCPGCVAPEWHEQKDAWLIEPAALADRILSVKGIEGITISGGEPMLQAEGLSVLIDRIRSRMPLTAICFTGFTLEALMKKSDAAIHRFLGQIDVLIDGPYVEALNDNKGLRGSSNQGIHFLTNAYRACPEKFTESKRDIEVHLKNDGALMVGVHPKDFSFTDFVQAIGQPRLGGSSHMWCGAGKSQD